MSTAAVEQFFAQIQNDENLQAELAKALEAENDRVAVTELAKSKGYEITSEELWAEVQKLQAEAQKRQEAGELSDEELETVAGGEALIVLGLTAGLVTGVVGGTAGYSLTQAKW